MRTLIHILVCCFCVSAGYGEDRFWLDAKINGKVARLSLDTGWGGQHIILFRKTADRLGLKVQPCK